MTIVPLATFSPLQTFAEGLNQTWPSRSPTLGCRPAMRAAMACVLRVHMEFFVSGGVSRDPTVALRSSWGLGSHGWRSQPTACTQGMPASPSLPTDSLGFPLTQLPPQIQATDAAWRDEGTLWVPDDAEPRAESRRAPRRPARGPLPRARLSLGPSCWLRGVAPFSLGQGGLWHDSYLSRPPYSRRPQPAAPPPCCSGPHRSSFHLCSYLIWEVHSGSVLQYW